MGSKAPCINCDNKGCGSFHDKCEKYLEFRRKREKELEDEKKERNEIMSANVARNDGIKRMKSKRCTNHVYKCNKKIKYF